MYFHIYIQYLQWRTLNYQVSVCQHRLAFVQGHPRTPAVLESLSVVWQQLRGKNRYDNLFQFRPQLACIDVNFSRHVLPWAVICSTGAVDRAAGRGGGGPTPKSAR